MNKRLLQLYRLSINLEKLLFPNFLLSRINIELFAIDKFVARVSNLVKPNEVVLDAGAGSCPYQKYFEHTIYESTDFDDIFDKSHKGQHTFVCNLEKIPKPKNYYDTIINTQVLEHVEHPQKVINEFYRILKPGGKLFLTAPQGYGLHGEPYNFYNFTKFGLKSLFDTAGFRTIYIEPRGGIFWCLADYIRLLPTYILYQQLFTNKTKATFQPNLIAAVILPFYILLKPICSYLIPLMFYFLDRLDKKQLFTLGYNCYCIKG